MIAGVLATAGVYGLRAYLVTQRRREIGIRIALGATRGAIIGQFVKEGTWLAAAGLVAGTVLAVGLVQLLRQSGLLYEVRAIDPLVFSVAPVLLAVATAAASYLPARRALSVDPTVALKPEIVPDLIAVLRSRDRRRSMLSSRTIPASLLCLALLSLTVQPGSAQQDANRPANQEPQAQAPQDQAPQDQAPQGQAPQGQEPQGQTPQGPTFRGGINFVRVDVIVDDRKDQPVTNLTQEDFEVLEDGKPQSVEQFSLVKVDGNPRPGDPPPREIRNRGDEELIANREDVRVFVFFLDDYHVRRSNSMSVREPLLRFVQNQLRPNDIVAIMYPLMPVSDLTFTRNHAVVSGAINSFVGRKFDYTPINQFEQNYMRYPTETVERIRNDVVMTALRGLSVRLGSLREGRKSVIFVSEGFTAMLPPQMRREDASQPDNPIRSQAAAAGQDSSQQVTAEWFGQTDVYSRMREVTRYGEPEQHIVLFTRPERTRAVRIRVRRLALRTAAELCHRFARAAHDTGHAPIAVGGDRRQGDRQSQHAGTGSVPGHQGLELLLPAWLHQRRRPATASSTRSPCGLRNVTERPCAARILGKHTRRYGASRQSDA